MIKVSKDDIKAVVKHLERKYEEEGRNYFFKSKHLSRELNVPAYIIGRVAMIEALKDNGRVEVVRHPGHGACLFRTRFKVETNVLCEHPTG